MNCDQFPVHSSQSICVDKKIQTGNDQNNVEMDNSIFNLGNIPIDEDSKHSDTEDKKHQTVFDIFSEHNNGEQTTDDSEELTTKKRKNNKRIKSNQKIHHKSSDNEKTIHQIDNDGSFLSTDCKCECRRPFVQINHLNNDKRYFNQIVTGNQLNCAMPCKVHPYFTRTEQTVAIFWITLFSFVCAFCTLITLLTFIANTKRFQYPERCIIFLSTCYLMVSIGFLIRIYVGHENVACDLNTIDNDLVDQQQKFNRRISQPFDQIQSSRDRNSMTNDLFTIIRYENTGQIPGYCLIVFWLLYYFGMCASVWWVLLTFTWFLQAALKWSNEAIDSYSQYFHLIAWFVPAIKSIIIISIGSIDGDPLTGKNLYFIHLYILI